MVLFAEVPCSIWVFEIEKDPDKTGRGGGGANAELHVVTPRLPKNGPLQPERVVHNLRTDAAIISFVVGIIATIIATTIIITEVRNKPLPPGQADREQSGDTPPLPCVPTAFTA